MHLNGFDGRRTIPKWKPNNLGVSWSTHLYCHKYECKIGYNEWWSLRTQFSSQHHANGRCPPSQPLVFPAYFFFLISFELKGYFLWNLMTLCYYATWLFLYFALTSWKCMLSYDEQVYLWLTKLFCQKCFNEVFISYDEVIWWNFKKCFIHVLIKVI